MKRLLLIAFFLEVGFVLILVPWSPFWDRNYFAQHLPVVEAIITNDFFRGGVSGLGVINLLMGIGEIASLFLARGQEPISSLRYHVEE
jgi:hypothetical protein